MQPRQHPLENPDRPQLRRRLPRAQHVSKPILLGLLIEPYESGHRQVTPGVVVAVEERQLLSTVRRIVRGIELHGDALGFTAPASALPPITCLGERLAHRYNPSAQAAFSSATTRFSAYEQMRETNTRRVLSFSHARHPLWFILCRTALYQVGGLCILSSGRIRDRAHDSRRTVRGGRWSVRVIERN